MNAFIVTITIMTPAEISYAKGGDNFEFTYAYADVADTQVFSGDDWGLYLADSVSVGKSITPDVDEDSVTSLPGTITFSVTLYHLDTFASSHVQWDGSGITVEYSLDTETWFPLFQDAVVALDGDSDFDIRVTFAGGVEDDPAVLNSITVYVLATDTIRSHKGSRTLTFSADPISEGTLTTDASVSVSAVVPEDDPEAPLPVTGTVEMVVTLNAPSAVIVGGPTSVWYVDGVSAWPPTVGVEHHIVAVHDTAVNTAYDLAPDCTISHIAFYPQQMTASDVATLYAAQTGLSFRVDDTDGLTVAEGWTQTNDDNTTTAMPAVEIYAYAWSISSGASS